MVWGLDLCLGEGERERGREMGREIPFVEKNGGMSKTHSHTSVKVVHTHTHAGT